MDKKTRIYPILIALLFAVAILTPVFAAAGGDEPAEEPMGTNELASESSDVASPFEDALSINEAVAAAFAVPASWDYDPDSRYIYEEGADIPYPISVGEQVWLDRLDEFEYYVMREQGTERAFSDPMHANKKPGIYYSRATGQPLFSSEDKYDSGTGWPSFSKPINPAAIVYLNDSKLFGLRIEVVDSLSGSHLGHVFPDGPAPTGQRYCINAASLLFVPDGEEPPAFIQELQAIAAAQ